MSWNPQQYLQYAGERLRPALDLIARIPLTHPATIVDLGCGAGNVARVLADRFPGAAIDGVDGDAAMLERARQTLDGDARFRWTQADLAAWHPPYAVDLLFSNAALHWLGDHPRLFRQLFAKLAPHGVLAVQMPDNHGAPSHQALFATARDPRWATAVAALVREHPVADLADYHDLLAPGARTFDGWRTTYLHVLAPRPDGEHPVVAWLRGSALTPFTAHLAPPLAEAFVADYAARIERAYPRRADGHVLFPFSRIFMIVQRGA
jgi:trans-aconitate 2-methyltransferase